MEPIIYFGLAKENQIDSLKVQWSDGKVEVQKNIKTNQCLTLHAVNAEYVQEIKEIKDHIFKEITDDVQFEFTHKENNFDDYKHQVLLPYKLSQLGPFITVGDVNNDDLDDFFIGNASGSPGKLFIQSKDGTFRVTERAMGTGWHV